MRGGGPLPRRILVALHHPGIKPVTGQIFVGRGRILVDVVTGPNARYLVSVSLHQNLNFFL